MIRAWSRVKSSFRQLFEFTWAQVRPSENKEQGMQLIQSPRTYQSSGRLSQGIACSRSYIRSLAVLLLLALPGMAHATFIDFSGTITGDGSVPAPFAVGDLLTGFIEIDDAVAAPNAAFDEDDLLDFEFVVGTVVFGLDDSQPFGFFDGSFAADGASLLTFNVSTSFGLFPNCFSCNLTLNAENDSFLVLVLGSNFGIAEGTLNNSVRAAPVPEPSVLALFALGLLLAGVVVTRRRVRV